MLKLLRLAPLVGAITFGLGFHAPAQADGLDVVASFSIIGDLAKNVGGDRIKVLAGRVYLNGRKQREPFIDPSADCDICNLPHEITIPSGMLVTGRVADKGGRRDRDGRG